MSEQNKPDDKSSQTAPAIAVVALLISLFAAQEIIFKPTRPSMINMESTFTKDVPTRLWQDPFQAVELYQKQFYSQSKSTKEIGAELPTITVEDSVSGNTFHLKITKENRTEPQPVPSKKPIPGTNSNLDKKSNRLTCAEIVDHSIEKLYCQIKKEIDEKEKSLHVLAVMVPGGSYAEDHEWRLRTRYALIFGLRAAGYSPVDSEHISFVDFQKPCRTENKRFCDFPDYMPYEWFELNEYLESINIKQLNELGLSIKDKDKNKKGRVLILWLNNDTFTHSSHNSLEQLDKLKNEIIPNSEVAKSEINFNIIGPYSSGTLKKMYADTNRIEKDYYLKHSHIFATFVTADDWRLIGSTKEELSKKLRDNDQLM